MLQETIPLYRTLYRRTNPPLLFLYQTRTILSPEQHTNRELRRGSRSQFSTSPRHSAPGKNLFDDFTDKKTSTREKVDSPESTITAPEQATFERIFNNLFNPSGIKTTPNDSVSRAHDGDNSEDVTLESIFEGAIRESKQRKRPLQKSAHNPGKQFPVVADQRRYDFVRPVLNTTLSQHALFPAALRRSLDEAREKALAAQPSHRFGQRWKPYDISEVEEMGRKFGEPEDEYERLVENVRRQDMERVTAMLDSAKSDIELWRVLETEVFSRMVELNKLLKKEEKAQKAATPKTKGRPARKDLRVPTVPEVNTRPVPQVPMATESMLSECESKPEGAPLAAQTSLSSLSPHPLSILQTNYALHLLHSIRLLRARHPTSPYGPALLTHIKSLGPISYVLGASTALYNELLYIRWIHYRDLHACADLVNEMIEQGLGTDDLTRAVFRDAETSRKRAGRKIRDGTGGWETGWWRLQGVVSGWEKWDEVQREAWRMLGEERERARREGIERDREEKQALADGSGGDESMEVEIALMSDRVEDEEPSHVHAHA